MDTHPNALLKALDWESLVRRHIDEGIPLAGLAYQAGISPRNTYQLLTRFRVSGG